MITDIIHCNKRKGIRLFSFDKQNIATILVYLFGGVPINFGTSIQMRSKLGCLYYVIICVVRRAFFDSLFKFAVFIVVASYVNVGLISSFHSVMLLFFDVKHTWNWWEK